MSDTVDFINLLFDPEDLIEFRVNKTRHIFVPAGNIERIEHLLAGWNEEKATVWAGACPRPRKHERPQQGRVLWCDLKDGAEVEDALNKGVPDPSMIVNSGHGFHFYWRLDHSYPVEELAPRLRAIHQMLPTDNTHDVTRVMRLPGSINWKRPDDPRPCTVLELTGDIYTLEDFPAVVEPPRQEQTLAITKTPLPYSTRQELLKEWTPGRRHDLALSLAGHLRVDLGYSAEEALQTIRSIAHEANDFDEEDYERVVKTTYEKEPGRIKGSSGLYELGVKVERPSPTLRLRTGQYLPSTIMPLVDLHEECAPVDYWWGGLIGKGFFSIWAGAPKVGKSFAIMQLAYGLATGTQVWDTPAQKKRVLYFQGELSDSMVHQRAKGMYPMIPPVTDLLITGKPSQVIDLMQMPEVLLGLAESYDVVIVDPISLFHGNDENSSKSVNEVINLFNVLTREGKSVVLVHHTRKQDGKTQLSNDSIRGSNAWFSRPDSIAVQVPHGETGAVKVKFTYRSAPERPDLILYRLSNGSFTHDSRSYSERMPGIRFTFDPLEREVN